MFEPQKRVLTPWRLDLNSPTSLATGLVNESELDRIPYGHCEVLQSFEHMIFGFVLYFDIRI